jgi:hypothetical protein
MQLSSHPAFRLVNALSHFLCEGDLAANGFLHRAPSPNDDPTDTDNIRGAFALNIPLLNDLWLIGTVESIRPLISPAILVDEELPITPEASKVVVRARRDIQKILRVRLLSPWTLTLPPSELFS